MVFNSDKSRLSIIESGGILLRRSYSRHRLYVWHPRPLSPGADPYTRGQIYIPAAGNNPYTGILFADDFSNPESGWPIFEDAVFANSYVEDEYQLRVKTQGGASWAFPSGRILKEYSAEIDVRVVEPGVQSSYGLVYDFKDPQHFSTFTTSTA